MITYHRTTVPVLCRTPLEGCAELRMEKLASRARLLGGPDLQACVPHLLVHTGLSFRGLPSLRTHSPSSSEVTLTLFHVSQTGLHRTKATFLATASLETWPFPPEASSDVRQCCPCPR